MRRKASAELGLEHMVGEDVPSRHRAIRCDEVVIDIRVRGEAGPLFVETVHFAAVPCRDPVGPTVVDIPSLERDLLQWNGRSVAGEPGHRRVRSGPTGKEIIETAILLDDN